MKLLSILTAALLSLSSLCYANTPRKALNPDFVLGTEMLSDGDFEGGYFGGSNYGTSGVTGHKDEQVWVWTNHPAWNNPITNNAPFTPRAGESTWCAYFNPYGDSSLYQIVPIPYGVTLRLSFWVYIQTYEHSSLMYDTLKVSINDVTQGSDFLVYPFNLILSNLNDTGGHWVQYSFDVSAFSGRTIRLEFDTHEMFVNGTTLFQVDDVSINAKSANQPGPGCVSDSHTLCLVNGRYQVTSVWRDQYANGWTAQLFTKQLSDVTGAFWIVGPDEYEYFVRINTATDNNRAWVQIAMFNDIEFWVTVTDTIGGQAKTYHNYPGNATLIYDPFFFVFP